MVKNLKILRVEKGISQAELGDLIHHSQQSVANYESGLNDPSLETLVFLADYFDTSTDYLLGRTNIKQKIEKIAPGKLINEESDLIDSYRNLTKKQRNTVSVLMDQISDYT